MADKGICHDCNCKEGELHMPGCDMERCPFCGGQLISCECRYTKLGFDYDWDKEFSGLPEQIYKEGLPEELEYKFELMLDEKGRIPYIQWPWVCGKCGKMHPQMFMVPDEEWEHYIQVSKRDIILCEDCYGQIKAWTDESQE